MDLISDNLLRHRRELNRGFADAFTASVEMALTPALFGGIGFAVDHWLGTFPGFMLALGLFALVGMFVRAWYAYDARMKVEEQRYQDRSHALRPATFPAGAAGAAAAAPIAAAPIVPGPVDG